jgi:hypothetical protein
MITNVALQEIAKKREKRKNPDEREMRSHRYESLYVMLIWYAIVILACLVYLNSPQSKLT